MSITLKEIAAKAGVTPRVVSAVVNDDYSRVRVGAAKRDKIRALLERHNYSPNAAARMLQSKKSRVFNVVIPSATFFLVPQYSTVIAGLQLYAESIGFRLEFTSLSEGYKDYASLEGLIGDGIVFFYWGAKHDDVLTAMLKFGLPVVTAIGRCGVPGASSLYFDNETATYRLAARLIERGHTRLGYAPQYGGDVYHRDGEAGLRRAVNEYGAEVRAYPMPLRVTNLFTPAQLFEAGARQMRAVLDDPFGATAVICTEDEAAMGAVAAASGAGRSVPDEMAVCGNGNAPHGAFWSPGITSIDMRPLEYGEALGRMLAGRIADGTHAVVKEPFRLDPVFRASTGIVD